MKNLVAKELRNIGIEFEIVEVVKGNSKLTGFSFSFGNNNVRPCIYLENYINRYDNPHTIAMEMYIIALEAMENNTFNTDNISSLLDKFENVKDKIFICVEPHSENKTYLTRNITKSIDEYYRVIIPDLVNGQTASTKVTQSLLENWGISRYELVSQARSNVRKSSEIIGILDAMNGLDNGKKIMYAKEITEDMMYVVSNEEKYFGAGVLADKFTLSKICDILNTEKILIIPSSIHELIIAKYNDEEADTIPHVIDLVRKVNSTGIAPKERLGDGCFIYTNYEDLEEFNK